ncbi:hypothetical protein Y032_0042g572 [Ancylostoma ceylanicum]|uniref:SCP domain-containing protein n=1 Tax=Ancylostoma ceylanicum TaxID=53326 RepID=A0A016UG15_9BILA|nr:hypothetical protein Y032_0042g572 [Ancylostoma ceylanicum]
MFYSLLSVAAIVLLLGVFPTNTDALQAFPYCKELGKYRTRDNIKKLLIGEVSTAEPLRGHLISVTIIYDCVLEGLAVLEMKRRGPANVCTDAGAFFTEKFEEQCAPCVTSKGGHGTPLSRLSSAHMLLKIWARKSAKRAGYKPKQFIEKAVKSFYPTIGKLGVMGKYGCSYATDETKYKLACVFMKP